MNNNGNGTVTARAGDGRHNGGGRLPAEERWRCSELTTFQIFRKSRTLARCFVVQIQKKFEFEIQNLKFHFILAVLGVPDFWKVSGKC